MMTSNPRRALDRWARDYGGCADFDTYIRAGGSIMAARDDIRLRVNRLSDAMRALQAYPNAPREAERDDRQWVEEKGYPGSLIPSPSPRENPERGATIGPEALARLEAEQHGGPVDADNAHVQGEDAALRGANDAV